MEWKDVKVEVCYDEAYKKANWFTELTEVEQILVEDLKEIQLKLVGDIDLPIPKQRNPIRAKFIDRRIDELLPDENFCFHKIFEGDSEEIRARNAIEKKDLYKLIEMHM